MCGIAGRINLNNKEVTLTDLKKMSVRIAHRGPDDEGFYISEDRKVGLVNRRLAIIDLSKKGHQPMSYKNRYIITFNGEIYNFQEERNRLQKHGYRFHSKTDTEVILALYDRYGPNCINHLRGMYAFVIYDKKKETIFGVRGRIGKKPFKYYYDQNYFIFASELKAILTQKEVAKNPDFLAIHHYLTFGYVPDPSTGFEGIRQLQPGHYLLLDIKNKKLVIKKYWQPDYREKLELSESEWCKKIMDEFTESTKLRMVADVPVGAFLSGGVDSSAVVATMARLSKKPINTFTIGFREKGHDESPYASEVAKLYKTNHHTIIAKPEHIEDLLPMLAFQFEEPFADSSAIVTYMVSKAAKEFVTVVLNGDGGDENFAGYDGRLLRFKRDVYLNNYLKYIRTLGIPLTSYLSKKNPKSIFSRANKFLKKSKDPLSERYVSYNSYFNENEKQNLYTNFYRNISKGLNSNYLTEDNFNNANTTNIYDQALNYDLVNWLPGSQLTKIDIASMAASLEARSPFLDQKLIELTCKIPFNLKFKGFTTPKYILKKALEDIVPKQNLYRKKMGFSIPLHNWFTGNLNKYARSKLLSRNTKTKLFLNQKVIRNMLSNHTEKNDNGLKLWALLTLELWFESYFG